MNTQASDDVSQKWTLQTQDTIYVVLKGQDGDKSVPLNCCTGLLRQQEAFIEQPGCLGKPLTKQHWG